VLADFEKAGIDLDKLAADLQSEGGQLLRRLLAELLNAIQTKEQNLAGGELAAGMAAPWPGADGPEIRSSAPGKRNRKLG